jgi:UDP-3-O-[3-hydroxymyristoyl] glucosamine N-acyltransferase
MTEPDFFPQSQTLTLRQVAEMAGVPVPAAFAADAAITGVAPVESAGPGDLAYMDNPAYGRGAGADAGHGLPGVPALRRPGAGRHGRPRDAPALPRLRADPGAPVSERHAARLHLQRQRRLARVLRAPTARLEHGVTVDPGAVVGPHAEIGSGTVVGANAVVGPHCRIGRDCSIGPTATVLHAFLGNRVILHPGVRIGQDGFGFDMSPRGHLKVPQVGRVIIQDDVEIGANTTVDRGASRDTVIGEGTKIDNLVQIAHNVVIGRHCVIVAQVGISGSTRLEDFVVVGGQTGMAGHVRIGQGAQIAARSGVMHDVPAQARWGGSPAQSIRDWHRTTVALKHLARRSPPQDPSPQDEHQ